MIKVFVVGNLTKDVELKEVTVEGKEPFKVAKFTVASNTVGKDSAVFIDCEAAGGLAEVLAKYTKKGSGIALNGDYTVNEYISNNGDKVRRVVIKANEVQFTDKKANEEGKE